MEYLIKADSGEGYIDPNTGECFSKDEAYKMFGYQGVYRQHMTDSKAEPEPEPEQRSAEEPGPTRPKRPEDMTEEERTAFKYDYPWLYYEGETFISVYWRKWGYALKKPWDWFAWEMINQAGELIGLKPIALPLLSKIKQDLRDKNIKARYRRRIEKHAKNEAVFSGAEIYGSVHAKD